MACCATRVEGEQPPLFKLISERSMVKAERTSAQKSSSRAASPASEEA